MKELDISEALKDWLTPKDLASLDKLVKYLEELGEKAKNIKTMDDAYDFAKNDLGMKCTWSTSAIRSKRKPQRLKIRQKMLIWTRSQCI